MKFWVVDAFTDDIFKGNPAAVFVFEDEPSRSLMQNIASEMNLSETAFVIKNPELTIRWFTPNTEVDLCGHATLSAAHILWENKIMKEESIQFQSKSGTLSVTKSKKGYTLDFPLQPPSTIPLDHPIINEIVDSEIVYAGSNDHDCMVVVSDASYIHSFSPNADKIASLEERGFLLTAQDQTGEFDYIYRAFFPKLDIPEDPVTGSANTCLAAFWSKKLNKKWLKAKQVSKREGLLDIEVSKSRILISGKAVTVIEGDFNLEKASCC